MTVYGFRECNDVERERLPLWRYWRILPPKGGLAPGGRHRFAAPGARGRPPSAAGNVGCAAFRRGQVAPPPAPVRTIASVRLGTRGAAPHPSDDEYDQELERLQGRLARLQVLRTLGDGIDAALD